jgi:outer membrane protein insertion porin family
MVNSTQALAQRIDKININGNKRIEKSTIQEYSGIKVGDEYSNSLRSDIVKNLYATSLFENINISFNAGHLKINVTETPFISRVEFAGNTKIKDNLLSNEIYTAAGESLKKAKLRTDIEKIKEIYKRSGRFSVQVKSKIQQQENNRVKVVFEINEGPKTGIKNIYFVGNENYKRSELKSLIVTKESRWFRFLETNDTYDPDRIEFDKYLLSQFYNSVGFVDFRVISVTAELLPTKEGFILTYSIEEGDKYNFGKTTLNNKLTTINDSEVQKFIDDNEGKIFNINLINRTTEKIAEHLTAKGYPQVDVRHELVPNPSSGTVDVVIIVDHAVKIFINKININGNLKTEDNVIRRQLKIEEGDLYNKEKITRGERNIRNLDYFANQMSVKMSPTEREDRYNLDINVEDKSTSSLSFDIGYNSAGGPFGRISFVERNLVGTGKILNTGIQIGKKNISYTAGVTDPSFMDKDLSLGFNLSRSENGKGSGFTPQEQKHYSSKSTAANVTMGYNITDDLTHDIDYTIKHDELKASDDKASVSIQEQMGKYLTSSISHSLTYDQTDSRILPKNGYITSVSQEYAGVGGDAKFLKHEINAKYYKSFVDNKYTIKFSAAAGHIKGMSGKKVKISERFNVGEHNLRGFASGGIGPRDVTTKEGFGGQKFYTLSSELNFPLGLPEEFNVTGALFVDIGSLWDIDTKTSAKFYNDKSLRASVGFGVLWITRIAPIRLDWGFPIKSKKYDEKQTFHIKFTTHF